MTEHAHPNYDVVICPGCGSRLAKMNSGKCGHCDWQCNDGPVPTVAAILAKQSWPNRDSLSLGDVSPAFVRALLDLGAGLPAPKFDHGADAVPPGEAKSDVSFWKTTVEIWTDFDPSSRELDELAEDVNSGKAICVEQLVQEVTDPRDFPDPALFMGDSGAQTGDHAYA